MKRVLNILLTTATLMASSAAIGASEQWWESYDRGVAAVQSKKYDVAVLALQRTLSEMPTENAAARPRRDVIIYVPHYWLGVAKFNLGDIDGALSDWKISEEQGAVQNTRYYAELREWVARAHSQKERTSESAAIDGKHEASMAAGRAVSAQMDAVAAGGDDSDAYRAGQRKLQESLDIAGKAGTSVPEYRRAAAVALQAHDLFAGAAEQARKQKSSRPLAARKQPGVPVSPSVPPVTEAARKVAQQPTVEPVPAPTDVTSTPPTAAAQLSAPAEPLPTRTENIVTVASPPPQLAAKVVTASRPVRSESPRASVSATTNDVHSVLEAAFRLFAAGDLGRSEQLLTGILATKPSGEAYLLRGCERYTVAILSRNQEPMLSGATADFRAALDLNGSLRLDPSVFSPKLVAFFDHVKRAR